jgi:hypothetical protein
MVDELEMIRNEVIVAYSRYYPRICLDGLRKTTETVCEENLCLGRDSNSALTEYKSSVLPCTKYKCKCNIFSVVYHHTQSQGPSIRLLSYLSASRGFHVGFGELRNVMGRQSRQVVCKLNDWEQTHGSES